MALDYETCSLITGIRVDIKTFKTVWSNPFIGDCFKIHLVVDMKAGSLLTLLSVAVETERE